MIHFPPRVTANSTFLHCPEVRNGLVMIAQEVDSPESLEQSLAFIQRLLNQPGALEWACNFFNATRNTETSHASPARDRGPGAQG